MGLSRSARCCRRPIDVFSDHARQVIRRSGRRAPSAMTTCGSPSSGSDANWQVYGPRKVWQQSAAKIDVARCTVERLMGAGHGRRGPRPRMGHDDRRRVRWRFGRSPVHRDAAQSALGPTTYVATWKGFVYVAFVIDVFSRRIVGWRVGRRWGRLRARCARTSGVRPWRGSLSGLVHHSAGYAVSRCGTPATSKPRRLDDNALADR